LALPIANDLGALNVRWHAALEFYIPGNCSRAVLDYNLQTRNTLPGLEFETCDTPMPPWEMRRTDARLAELGA
jgi:hypothetical protein